MAENLQNSKDKIQAANQIDLDNGEKTGVPAPLMQRLLIDDKKIERMVDNLRQVAALPDPIRCRYQHGRTSEWTQNRYSPCTYRCRRRSLRVAPGCDRQKFRHSVSNPGTALFLRGGSEAIHSNATLARILSDTAAAEGVPDAIQFVDTHRPTGSLRTHPAAETTLTS